MAELSKCFNLMYDATCEWCAAGILGLGSDEEKLQSWPFLVIVVWMP